MNGSYSYMPIGPDASVLVELDGNLTPPGAIGAVSGCYAYSDAWRSTDNLLSIGFVANGTRLPANFHVEREWARDLQRENISETEYLNSVAATRVNASKKGGEEA
jgi:hypothetical protein